jgi:CRISPR/Cas system CSM-associated protein Csm4 (group 5 of RAMP superfamily)
MALNALNIKCNVEDLMDEARKFKYTKNGEIFDSKQIKSNYLFIYFDFNFKILFLIDNSQLFA